MARISIPTPEQAPAESRPILDAIHKNFGFVPNVAKLLSLSPTALQAFVGLQGTLTKALDQRTRDSIALAVSQANESNYCVAAHSFSTNAMSNTTPAEIALNLQGKSDDPKTAAAANFAKRLIETHGQVTDPDLSAARKAGYTDAQLVEMIAVTAQVLLTNFVNNVATTDIDIPAIKGK